jgi:mRNA interferase MazF
MTRGELYRVHGPEADPKRQRVYVIVSREGFVAAPASTVICAPVYTTRHGIDSEVHVGVDEGLKHASTIACDLLQSVPRSILTNYVGALSREKLAELHFALRIALGVD